ncbi:MAG: RNA polymerase, partial [Nitrospira sp.]
MADDLEIIRRVLSGETDGFAELIARYQQHVARIVNRHVPPDLVAEVAHDVFVRAYDSLSGFAGESPFDHWLS